MSRWDAFSSGELDELHLSLDHRLAEAENGNAYVYTQFVAPLLLDLVESRPDVLNGGSETIEDVRERVAAFNQPAAYERITGAPTKVLRIPPLEVEGEPVVWRIRHRFGVSVQPTRLGRLLKRLTRARRK